MKVKVQEMRTTHVSNAHLKNKIAFHSNSDSEYQRYEIQLLECLAIGNVDLYLNHLHSFSHLLIYLINKIKYRVTERIT